MSLIEVKNLSVGYEQKAVVEYINFTVEEQEYLYIIGENGAGKSTLMKTLLGLIPPVSGTITLGDELNVNTIGYLPQQTQIQRDFPALVEEIVLSGCLNSCGLRPFFNRQEKELARKNMERLGILKLQKRCYRELSGGQQQRVLLARALCASKKLLLLDEPTAGLDPAVTEEMYELIEGINREGMAVIIISHDLTAAESYAGKVLYVGEQTAVYPNMEEFYLEKDKKKSGKTGGERRCS